MEKIRCRLNRPKYFLSAIFFVLFFCTLTISSSRLEAGIYHDNEEEYATDGKEEYTTDGKEEYATDGEEEYATDGKEEYATDGKEEYATDGKEEYVTDGKEPFVAGTITIADITESHNNKTIIYNANGGYFGEDKENNTKQVNYIRAEYSGTYTPEEEIGSPNRIGYIFKGRYTEDDEPRTGLVSDSTPEGLTVYANRERATGLSSALVTPIDAPGAEGYGGLKFDDGKGHVIMLLDRNLGATTTGAGDKAPAQSYGNYYTRGNNNYLQNIPSDNVDSRGGGDDDAENLRGLLSTTADNIQKRRGPCPEGYHIPSIGEWNALYVYRATAFNNYYYETYDINRYINFFTTKGINSLKHSSEGSYEFMDAFNIPYNYNQNGLRSSSPSYFAAYPIRFPSLDGYVSLHITSDRNKKYPVRCFYDAYLEPSFNNQYASIKQCSSGTSCYLEGNSGIFYNTEITVSYTDPNGNKFDAGTITISDGNNTITMLDRDLGSRCNYRRKDQNPCSNGYDYQWGNNFGFKEGWAQGFDSEGNNYSIHDLHIGNATLSLDKINRNQQYGPGNRYTSNLFRATSVTICNGEPVTDGATYENGVGTNCNYYDGVRKKFWVNQDREGNYGTHNQIANLWGGGSDTQSNNRGLDNINNTASNRQGPCPDGYHIPSAGEWELLIQIYNSKFTNYTWNTFTDYLRLSNGYLRKNLTVYPGAYGVGLFHQIRIQEGHDGPVYWSSSFGNDKYPIILYSSSKYSNSNLSNQTGPVIATGDVMEAKPIRCFKDEPLDLNPESSSTTYTLTINYQYEGGGTAKPTYTATLSAGSNYNVQSPTVEGYTANKTNVSGTINSNTTITVIYTKNTSSGGDTGGGGGGGGTTSTSNTITLTTNRSNPYTNQYINLTINNTNKNYTDKLYLSAKYRSSSSSDWYSISNNVSSTYFSDYSNEREDGYYKMKESDNGKVTLTNLVQFKKSGYYRIYVKDVNGNEKYISFTVDSDDDTSSENEYLDISISPSSPDTDEWIKLNIETDDDYTGKISFSKFQYKSSSSSSWSTIPRISSTYVSEYSSTRSNGYYKMKSSDDGEVTLKNLIKFKKGGYYRIYVEDTDDNEEYVQFYVESNDDEEETNSNKKSKIAIDITNQYPYTNNRIGIIINVDTDYTGKINFKKIEYYNNSSRKDVSSSSEYIGETSNEWDNGYYKMVSNDYGYKRISNFIKLKKEGKYRIYAETKDGVSDYIQFSVTEYNSTEYNETYTNTGRTETSTDDDIEAMLNQLLNPTGYNYTGSSYTESTNLYIDTSDEIYKSRSCKEYKLQYNSDLGAFTSPDLQKTEYFINKDYFKRYIDSKNPRKEGCPSNEGWISSSYVDNSNSTDKYIAPNGKIYIILYENGKYHSNQLTKTVDFSSYTEIKYYIRDRNPLINMATNTK